MFTLLLSLSPAALAATLTVDPDDTSAYATISDALEDAEDGDLIDVVAGVFTDCLVIEELSVEIEGAGMGSTLLAGDGSCDPLISLDDGASLTLSELSLSNTGQPALAADDSTVVLHQIAIEDSGNNSSYYYGGAAILLDHSSLTATSCTFEDNVGYYGGHLFVSDRSDATVSDSSFVGGYGVYGGAIFLDGVSALSLDGTTFEDNRAYYYGGAVYMVGASELSASGDTFTDNTSTGSYSYNYGGSLYVGEFSSASLESATFTGSTAAYGGAIFLTGSSVVELADSTLSEGVATYTGGAVYVNGASVLRDAGSLFSGNEALSSVGAVSVNGGSLFDATGSTFEDNTSPSAGAVYYYTDSSGTLDGATFRGNTSAGSGGAVSIYSVDETLTIRDSLFEDNAALAGYGGAVYAQYYVDLVIEGTTFTGNSSSSYGGALVAWYDVGLSITDSVFEDNSAASASGGAVVYYDYYGDNRELVVAGTRFVGNSSPDAGALSVTYADHATITDSWFEGNSALGATEDYAYEGGAIYLYGNDEVSVQGSVFCHNEAGSGAAAYAYYNTVDTWLNNLFIGNTALRGGALMHYYNGDSVVINNTFAGNVARDAGSTEYLVYNVGEFVNNAVVESGPAGAVEVYDTATTASTRMVYDGFFDNEGSDGAGAWWASSSDDHVFDDPVFVAWSNDGDCTNDDLRLDAGSALRDLGDPDILDGDGTRSDIGAYGGPDALAEDRDGDGFFPLDDCDDFDPEINPDATEVCNDRDDDCNGIIDDEGAEGTGQWYADEDGDGYGDEAVVLEACEQPEDSSEVAGDCDDTDETVFPGAQEIEDDGIDQDCDGADETSEPVDTGEDADDFIYEGDLTGCGCSVSEAPGRGAWFLLLPALVVLRRRGR